MKQIISIFIMTLMFSMVVYAGQWKKDETGWRYQSDDGTYKTGWHQDVDGKWYYFDDQTSYMLADTITPDGYTVSPDGVWIEGSVTEIEKNNGYDNKAELEVTSYEIGPKRIKQFESPVPVTVYYNNEYKNLYTGNIEILRVEVSREGRPFIVFKVDSRNIYEFLLKCKFIFTDGTYSEEGEIIMTSTLYEGEEVSRSISSNLPYTEKNKTVASIEIQILESKRPLK